MRVPKSTKSYSETTLQNESPPIPGPWVLLAVGTKTLDGFDSSFNYHAQCHLCQTNMCGAQIWLGPLAAYSVCDTPIFEDIMGKRFFLLKLLRHNRIVHSVSIVQRLPVIDALFHLTYPMLLPNIQLCATGSYVGGHRLSPVRSWSGRFGVRQ